MRQTLTTGAVLAAVGALVSCSSHEKVQYPDRTEVYYRDFDQLSSFLPWSQEAAIKSAPHKFVLVERERIRELHDLLTMDCDADRESLSRKPDVYLLVREYEGATLVRTFAASPFVYTVAPSSGHDLCTLPAKQRDEIDALLMAMASEEPR